MRLHLKLISISFLLFTRYGFTYGIYGNYGGRRPKECSSHTLRNIMISYWKTGQGKSERTHYNNTKLFTRTIHHLDDSVWNKDPLVLNRLPCLLSSCLLHPKHD
jgi:hypothetical protein